MQSARARFGQAGVIAGCAIVLDTIVRIAASHRTACGPGSYFLAYWDAGLLPALTWGPWLAWLFAAAGFAVGWLQGRARFARNLTIAERLFWSEERMLRFFSAKEGGWERRGLVWPMAAFAILVPLTFVPLSRHLGDFQGEDAGRWTFGAFIVALPSMLITAVASSLFISRSLAGAIFASSSLATLGSATCALFFSAAAHVPPFSTAGGMGMAALFGTQSVWLFCWARGDQLPRVGFVF